MIETALTVGDPDAMRELASALTGRADGIAATTGRISGNVQAAVFEGPAADRVRGVVDGARSQAMNAVELLRQAAASLRADANEVERQNDALRAAAVAKAADADAAATASTPTADAEGPASAAPATGAAMGGVAP